MESRRQRAVCAIVAVVLALSACAAKRDFPLQRFHLYPMEELQWAPAPAARQRYTSLAVFVPMYDNATFNDEKRAEFAGAFTTYVNGSTVKITQVEELPTGLQVHFNVNYNRSDVMAWIDDARKVYDVMQTSSLHKVWSNETWPTIYPVAAALPAVTTQHFWMIPEYQLGTTAHALTVNLELLEHSIDWVTNDIVQHALMPIANLLGDSIDRTAWRFQSHGPNQDRVAVTLVLQFGAFSQGRLHEMIPRIQKSWAEFWPRELFGKTRLSVPPTISLLGGLVKSQ